MSGGASALRRLRRTGSSGRTAPAPRQPLDQSTPDECCEMCAARIGPAHSHVVALERRSLLCTCRPCALLFTERGAGRGRFRAVPDRVLRDPRFTLTDAQWDELRIPVRMAFFFHNSELGHPLAFYPSPAGATESLLPMDTWLGGIGATTLATTLEPDVEALLVRRSTDGAGECLLVPIDVCYELVGLVRTHWRGFAGGSEVWAHIDGFFARLGDRARELRS